MGQVQGLIPGMKREEDVPDPAPPAEGEYAEYTEEQYAEQGYAEQGYTEEQYAQWTGFGRAGSAEEERRGVTAFQTNELEKCLRRIHPANTEAKTTKPVKPVFSSRRLPEKHTLSLSENNSHLSKIQICSEYLDQTKRSGVQKDLFPIDLIR